MSFIVFLLVTGRGVYYYYTPTCVSPHDIHQRVEPGFTDGAPFCLDFNSYTT